MNTYLTNKDEKYCYGCLSCVYSCPTGAISIEKRFDEFSFPTVDAEKCINCDKCKRVCVNDSFETVINPIKKTYALKYDDMEIRKFSSSGGAFTALSDILLNEGYIIYGAVFEETYHYVKHIGSAKKEDRNRMRISKYVESNTADIYPDIKEKLDSGEKIFFTGTPCQVAGLKLFLQKNYDNLFTMDFSCHGVESPKLMSDYVDALSNRSKISYFSYRDNVNNNWDSSQTPCIICEDNKNLYYLPYCYRLISRSIGLRTSCSNCKMTQDKRSSDITVGDLWSINWMCPELYDDYGVSFFAVNTDKGNAILEKIKKSCVIKELDRNKAISGMSQLNNPTKGSSINKMFWRYYKRHSIEKTLEIYGSDSMKSKLMRKPFEYINKKLK